MEKANCMWPHKVIICEVGLRDGLQNEEKIFALEEKLQLLNSVVASGVKVIEVGSFVHPKAVPAMANTDKLVAVMEKMTGVEYRVLVPNLKGIERAFASGIRKVKLTVSASEAHCINNFNKKPLEMMEGFKECVDFVARHNMEVSGAISTSFGCPFQGKVPVEQVESVVHRFVNLGITELSLSDTTGMANPRQVFELGSYMKKKFSQVKWVMHFHNTRDMALANIVAGMQAGITAFDGSFAGLGGCPFAPGASGNVATEDVVHMLHEMGIDTGINLEKAIMTARMAEQMAGHQAGGAVLKAGRCEDLTKQQVQRQNNN
ncbi:MAG TPA: hydroxymethylglutaryl-CoA lyase [Patescibacteria group bacterium]|nr:hydroxymethylglutaryl-CoA lyase [Patescibacteria group bacterium]